MAELTNETVKRLNKVLEALAKAKEAESTSSPAAPPATPAEAAAAEQQLQTAQDLEFLRAQNALKEEKRELTRRKAQATRAGDAAEWHRIVQEQEGLRERVATAEKKREIEEVRREARKLQAEIRTQGVSDARVAQLRALETQLDDYAGAVDRAAAAEDDLTEAQRAGTAAAESWMNTALGPSSKMLQGLNTALANGAAGIESFAQGIIDSAASGELFLNIGTKLVDITFEMAKYMMDFALEQDKAVSSFRKATGAGKEFNDEIRNTERRLFTLGVSTAEAAAATGELKNSFTDFTYLSDSARDSVRDQALMLEKLGMDYATSSGIIQTSTQAMGLSVEQAEGFLLDIASTARSLGVDVKDLGADFIANADFMSSFGEEGTKIFEEMAVQAKALGVEMSLLTGMVDKFTKFDDAGKSVGRLNAILGGPFLNSIDMLNAAMEDPAEAIRMLRGAVDEAGVSFENMGRAQKMAMADALGMSIKDMTSMMGKSNEELEIQRIKQEELAEQARQTQSITEQLTSAMNAFYIQMGPLIDNVLVPLAGVLASVGAWIGNLMSSTGGMIAFFTLLGALMGSGIGLMIAFTAAIPGVGLAMAAISWAAVFKSLALGAMIGGGVGLATGLGAAAIGGSSTATPAATPSAAGFARGGLVTTETTRPSFARGGLVTTETTRPRFNRGGVIDATHQEPAGGSSTTATAMVGEEGPEFVEMPIGSRVTSAPTTVQLTSALRDLSAAMRTPDRGSASIVAAIKQLGTELSKGLGTVGDATGDVAVYVGDKEVTDIVIKALNSPKGKRALGTYGK